MTDQRTTSTAHDKEQDIIAMTPSKNTAIQPADVIEQHAAVAEEKAGLRLVEDDETGELTAAEAIEHHAGLAVANEQAAAELRAEAAKFTAEADSHKAELRKLLEPGKHPVGNLVVSVTEPSRSTDWGAFEKSYPVETNPALYKSVVNSAAVPPNLKEQFMVAGTGERRIAIK